MNKQIRFLRIASFFLIAVGLMTASRLFWLNTPSVPLIFPYILYSLSMFIIAFGLLKLMPWARYAAIIILVVNVISFLKNSIPDTIIMYEHSFGLSAKVFTLFIAATMFAIFLTVQAGIIWWLSKSSTKTLFDEKKERLKKGTVD
jgi:hypothetical protein